jgi:O-antigen ligase
MLTDGETTASRLLEPEPPPETVRPRRRRGRGLRTQRTLAFAGGLGLVLAYALRGGSYDAVVFQEHGLVVWWIVALALALGLLPRSRPSAPALVLLGVLLTYAVWTGLSLLWTQSSERSTQELARTLDYTGVVVLVAFALDRRTWRAGAAGLGLGAMIVCALAVGSRLAPSVFPVDYVDTTFHIDRLSYPFGYWNAVAAWAAMSIAIGLAWSAHDPSRIRRGVALALVPVAGLTLYLTYSRAGVAGAGIAVIAVLALSRNRLTAALHALVAGAGTAAAILAVRGAPQIAHATGTAGAGTVFAALLIAAAAGAATAVLTHALEADRWRMPRRLFRPLAGTCAVLVLVAAAAVGPRLVSKGWHSFTRTTVTSTTDPTARLASLSGSRYPLWKVTLKAYAKHPLDGTGAGTFEFWWDRHATDAEFVRDSHNIWLQNMAELGTPGLLLIVAVAVAGLVLAGRVRYRARRPVSAGVSTAFLAAYIVFLVHASLDWMWQSTAVTVLALAGVAAVGARGASRPLRLGLPVRGAVVALAACAGLIQLPGLISTASIRRSQAAERAGNANAALAWAKTAVNAEPWSASAYEQRGLVLEAAGQLGQAASDERRATQDEPTNFRHWLVLARIDTERGAIAQAVRDDAHAHELRPLARVFALAPYFNGTPLVPALNFGQGP